MIHNTPREIRSLIRLYEVIPEDQRIIADILRLIIIEKLPGTCREKIVYNVPYFYGKKGICIVWPAAIPRGHLNRCDRIVANVLGHLEIT